MTDEQDDLDEFVADRTRENPDFPTLVEAVAQRRALLRKLAGERERAGLSQTRVAARMGTSQSSISRLEAGEANPTLSTLEAYAIAIGKRLQWSLVEPAAADSTAA